MKTKTVSVIVGFFSSLSLYVSTALGLSANDCTIAMVDADGMVLTATHGLNQKLENKSQKLEAENTALKQQNELLQKRLENLGNMVISFTQN